MDKYNQKSKKIEDKPKFMNYQNIQNKNSKVKKFVIDAWEFETKMISNKKTIDETEKNDILEKDDNKMINNADLDEVVLDRNRQFSFQKIIKSDKYSKSTRGGNPIQEKKEIGGLLKTLGKQICGLIKRHKRNFE